MNAAGTAIAQSDPRERLGELFDRHHDRLFRLALRLVDDREEALDLVQDAFVRAARRLGSVPDGDGAAEAWLVRIVVNLCRDTYRRRKVRSAYRDRVQAESRLRGVAPDERPETQLLVAEALRALSPRRRAAIVLCDLEGRTAPEAARLLGISAVTVRWHLKAGRSHLARLLEGEPPETTS